MNNSPQSLTDRRAGWRIVGNVPATKRKETYHEKGNTMNINDLTLGQIREIQGLGLSTPGHDNSAWEVGKIYLIRTVTMIDTGVLVAVTPQELVLEDAAWIPDTGRFSDALKSLEFDEVEPFPDGRVIIGRGAVIDAVQIAEKQRLQK